MFFQRLRGQLFKALLSDLAKALTGVRMLIQQGEDAADGHLYDLADTYRMDGGQSKLHAREAKGSTDTTYEVTLAVRR